MGALAEAGDERAERASTRGVEAGVVDVQAGGPGASSGGYERIDVRIRERGGGEDGVDGLGCRRRRGVDAEVDGGLAGRRLRGLERTELDDDGAELARGGGSRRGPRAR